VLSQLHNRNGGTTIRSGLLDVITTVDEGFIHGQPLAATIINSFGMQMLECSIETESSRALYDATGAITTSFPIHSSIHPDLPLPAEIHLKSH